MKCYQGQVMENICVKLASVRWGGGHLQKLVYETCMVVVNTVTENF